jgi:hypothetical protein
MEPDAATLARSPVTLWLAKHGCEQYAAQLVARGFFAVDDLRDHLDAATLATCREPIVRTGHGRLILTALRPSDPNLGYTAVAS